ncbi:MULTISPECIES: SRPBCC family protein [Actinomadura]|uniref:SRPBCC family protein n=1 Tax=Actinomadura TaxID=1988 RepID=UPI000419ECB8|nr:MULTISPECIES: SRPBCC family protein [Actinomadura]RSN39351.1 cyclase [Actinomadura sp. WAC 06369]
MGTITESVNVTVPVAVAYRQWTRSETFPRFMAGVREVRRIDEATTRWAARGGGVVREFDVTVVERLPQERIAWTSPDGPLHSGVVTFRRLDATTARVTVRLEFDPERIAARTGDRAGALTRRLKGDLQRFKRLVEGRARDVDGVTV